MQNTIFHFENSHIVSVVFPKMKKKYGKHKPKDYIFTEIWGKKPKISKKMFKN